MRQIKILELDQAYLHLVPRQGGPEVPELADLPVRVNDTSKHFLVEHARRVLTDRAAVSATFLKSADVTPALVDAALADDEVGVASRALAMRLHNAMTHPRIPAGYLAAVRVSTTDDGDDGTALALMKIDADESATSPKHIPEPDGLRIDIEEREGYLPQVGKKLEKAAVLRKNMDGQSEMLVVDHQSQMARFWLSGFLQAGARLDAAARTDILQEVLIAVVNDVRDAIDVGERSRLATVTRGIIQQDRVDLDQVAAALPGEASKESFRQRIDESNLDTREFAIDPSIRDRVLRRSRWTGDHSLSLQIDAEVAGTHVFVLNRGEELPSDAPATGQRVVVFADNIVKRA